MKHRSMTVMRSGMFLLSAVLFAALAALLWQTIPWASVRWSILVLCTAIYAVVGLWAWYQRRQVSLFADDLCETLDALMSGREVEGYEPYEDSLTAKVQGKLMQYFDIMSEGQRQSRRDKETIQGLVSDISHQVKTPIANIKMFTGILRSHDLPAEKRAEFLATMDGQIDKLDFLMQSLIKMSRLETGTFALHPEQAVLADTIARAMSTVWAKAESKGIRLSAACDGGITVRHDPKWTAEALSNILDNAVKYTPPGGSVTVTVRPWQFYTRVDITDTGMGIPEEHYNDIFQRFYRAQEAAAEEGVGLGLYLANGIITRQNGYISVKSCVGKGTTFSVYLLS
ncbi:MAG: sensor histidine kinase [Subdoligranulum variabile]|nr:MAG: sensor histidine kinase [Subdoligranulum variabile]